MIVARQPGILHRIRHHIARWLFSEEVAKVDMERQAFIAIQKDVTKSRQELEAEREEFRKWAESRTIVDAVRMMLKGFDPKVLDDEDDLPEVLQDVESDESFLQQCKSLKDNDALWIIVKYLIRNQVLYSAKEAKTLDDINFGRATINGLSLLREEVDRLASVYAKRHTAKPKFDEHEVV